VPAVKHKKVYSPAKKKRKLSTYKNREKENDGDDGDDDVNNDEEVKVLENAEENIPWKIRLFLQEKQKKWEVLLTTIWNTSRLCARLTWTPSKTIKEKAVTSDNLQDFKTGIESNMVDTLLQFLQANQPLNKRKRMKMKRALCQKKTRRPTLFHYLSYLHHHNTYFSRIN
jgi:hypothetical protein